LTDSIAEKVRRKRREVGYWTVEDERKWIRDHPEDTPKFDLGELELVEAAPSEQHDVDLVPDIEPYHRSNDDEAIDAVIDRIGIVEAYNRWAHKGQVEAGNRSEGIKVRCPDPAHPDRNPSAWLNTDKDLWTCGACGMGGGDKFDIAAWGLGFPVPGYKQGKKFPELRRAMAVDLGYVVRTNRATGSETVSKEVAPVEASSATPVVEDVSPEASDGSSDNPSAPVVALYPEAEPSSDINPNISPLDWRAITREGGFLRSYMDAATKDDLPEEFHFWNGLIAVGLAAGRDVYLEDYTPVLSNLFITTIGNTGSGKSRSIGNLTRMLREALPYDATDPSNTGAEIITSVGSGEALIDAFAKTDDDGSGDPQTVPVRGLVNFNELATLVGKSAQTGSILKPILMDFYDGATTIASHTRGFGKVKAHDAFASCVTTTQADSLRTLAHRDDATSGFLNRWVFVFGTPKQRTPYGGVPINLDEPTRQLRGLKTWTVTHGPLGVTLEGEALDLWVDFFRRVIEPHTERADADPLLGRLALLFKKLMLLFAIDRREATVSVQTVRDATSLWGYIQRTYMSVGASISYREVREIEDAILAYIEKVAKTGRKGPTRAQTCDALKNRWTREEIKRSIRTLEEVGLVEEITYETGATRGPKKTALVKAIVDF
jgi:hypothetical protein